MKQNIFKIFISICLIVLGYTFCYYQHKQVCVEDIVKEVQVIKEKVIRDTIFSKKPVYINKQIVRTDTVQLYDIKHDSVQVELPYISKEFKDSLYEAWVSGYQEVNLDSIRVFKEKQIIEINNTKYVTKYKNRPFGFSIGVGGTYSPVSNKIEPGIFLGITYTIKSFGKR